MSAYLPRLAWTCLPQLPREQMKTIGKQTKTNRKTMKTKENESKTHENQRNLCSPNIAAQVDLFLCVLPACLVEHSCLSLLVM